VKNALWRDTRKWEDVIKIDLEKTEYEGRDLGCVDKFLQIFRRHSGPAARLSASEEKFFT
jgi:hypothetical protein